jgi:hypothetical protein
LSAHRHKTGSEVPLSKGNLGKAERAGAARLGDLLTIKVILDEVIRADLLPGSDGHLGDGDDQISTRGIGQLSEVCRGDDLNRRTIDRSEPGGSRTVGNSVRGLTTRA